MASAGAVSIAVPAYAQTEQLPAHVCAVSGGEPLGKEKQTVYASCWGTGTVLGEADRFEVFQNVPLKSTLVELELNGKRRVLLLRGDVGGFPVTEDMNSSMAASVGRAPWAGVEGLELDYSEFGETGVIAVQERVDLSNDDMLQRRDSASAGFESQAGEIVSKRGLVSIGDHLASDSKRVSETRAEQR